MRFNVRHQPFNASTRVRGSLEILKHLAFKNDEAWRRHRIVRSWILRMNGLDDVSSNIHCFTMSPIFLRPPHLHLLRAITNRRECRFTICEATKTIGKMSKPAGLLRTTLVSSSDNCSNLLKQNRVLLPRDSVDTHLRPPRTVHPTVIHRLPDLDGCRQQPMIHIAIKMA